MNTEFGLRSLQTLASVQVFCTLINHDAIDPCRVLTAVAGLVTALIFDGIRLSFTAGIKGK